MTMMIGSVCIALRVRIRLILIATTTKDCWWFPLSCSIYFVTRVPESNDSLRTELTGPSIDTSSSEEDMVPGSRPMLLYSSIG